MKRYISLFFVLFCMAILDQPLYASQENYSFTLENTIRNKKIYGAIYERLGTLSWKVLDAVFPLEYNKPYTVMLSSSKKYVYAFAASDLMLAKETITDQEKDALEAKSIDGNMYEKIASVSFSEKNPLHVNSLKITNDYSYPLFIARYIFDPLKKDLSISLASLIYRCASKDDCTIQVPVDYRGKDVVLVASRTLELLTAILDITKMSGYFDKKSMFMSRSNFEKLKTSNIQKKASELFADNNLTIINDTARNWVVGIYSKQGLQLQRLADEKNVLSGKNITFNKHYFLPISDTSQWLLFDTSKEPLLPLVSLNHTMYGGTIMGDAQTVRLSRWFSASKDISEKNKVAIDNEVLSKNNDESTVGEKTPTEVALNDSEATASEKEHLLQEILVGSDSFQVSNGTTKDIFVALYTRKDKQFVRRGKPMKIPVESAGQIGFEKNELLAFSVSSLELKESFSRFEWNNVNTKDPEPYKERDFVLRESDFIKENSFDLSEITIKNDNYSDIAVGRYEQKKWGIFTLSGVIQRVAKKKFELAENVSFEQEDDTPKDLAKETSNFALPEGYRGFIGYNNAYDENEYSSALPEKIETQLEFEMNHLTRIDTTDKKIFDTEKDLTGVCITVENDTNQGNKWVGVRIASSPRVLGITSIAQGSKKRFIPYQERMKIVVKDDFFKEYDLRAPYGEIVVNLPEQYHYLLTGAIMMSSAQAQKIEKDKKRVIEQIIQKQKEQERQKVVEKIEPQRKPINPKKEPKKEMQPSQKPLQFPVSIKEEKKEKLESVKPQKNLKESACMTHQIRVMNYSGKDIVFRFYYRGFFSTTPVADSQTYGISNDQELCFDLPPSTYLSDRYIVVDDDFAGLKSSYANKEIGQLMKSNRAFRVEQEKKIAIKNKINIG